MENCPVPGCDFTYPSERIGLYRTHRAGVHVPNVKVCYFNPHEEITIVRVASNFQCIRCSKTYQHPNGIQVRDFYFANDYFLIKLSARNMPKNVRKSLPWL